MDGLLKDATRPPGRKPLSARKIKQVVYLVLNEKPLNATHWGLRTMAASRHPRCTRFGRRTNSNRI